MKKGILTKLLLTAAVTSILLSGCQNSDVDYNLDIEESFEQGISPLDLEEGQKWEEDLTISDGREVSIKCSIKIPDVEQMSVAEVQRQELNEEYHKAIIKALYGSLEVYSNEEEDWSKARVQKVLDELQGQIEYHEAEIAEYKSHKSGDWTDRIASHERNIEKLRQEKQVYQKLYENAKAEAEVVTDFTKTSYYGTHASCIFILNIKEDEEGTSITFEAEDVQNICPEGIEANGTFGYAGEDLMESDYTENDNQCEMSGEDARKLAEKTLGVIGWTSEWEEIEPLFWRSYVGYQEDPVKIYDGYCFECSLGDGQMTFGDFDTGYELLAGCDGSLLGEASVFINDKGVLKVEIKNPVKLINMTNNVNLLSLDSIKGMIRKEINKNPDKYLSESGLSPFYEMELNYIRVKDKERDGYYSYVPAWRLCFRTGNDEYRTISRYPVIVNAIDGSVIDLEDVVE